MQVLDLTGIREGVVISDVASTDFVGVREMTLRFDPRAFDEGTAGTVAHAVYEQLRNLNEELGLGPVYPPSVATDDPLTFIIIYERGHGFFSSK